MTSWHCHGSLLDSNIETPFSLGCWVSGVICQVKYLFLRIGSRKVVFENRRRKRKGKEGKLGGQRVRERKKRVQDKNPKVTEFASNKLVIS